jgi:hypothetical protein
MATTVFLQKFVSKCQSDDVVWCLFVALLIVFFTLVAIMPPSTGLDGVREHPAIGAQNGPRPEWLTYRAYPTRSH